MTWRRDGEEVSYPVGELARVALTGLGPLRWFSWRRDQRHRPGLKFLVSTGRLHGFESLEEARLLLALDFAGEVIEVLPQPLRLGFHSTQGRREHTPDFLVLTRTGMWLVDVRPAELIEDKDRESFAAAAELAGAWGWHFAVAAGWRGHVPVTLDWLSSRRRPLSDPLGLEPGLLAGAAEHRTFGELAESSACPPVARAHLLHLLWHRRVGLDLMEPLGDQSVIVSGEMGG
ncbi:TnsA-like heteromeric transposase endonuclease subunit [Streptomyces sp. NRRL WC-3618]|uniref:TnsA-like heteromeric transposase endonuclease subunit n=1 Tax=Streptomyces sp. NRRL WC-3618 TaxID=1519490 RepID=UPI000A9FDECC|nr:TnsA-like heteromeric transposase endonuclease subunit [Streptomyces sp. NRRL WC-3618]